MPMVGITNCVIPLAKEISEVMRIIDDRLWKGEELNGLDAYLEHLLDLEKNGEVYYCTF